MNKLSYTTLLAAAFLLPGCSEDAIEVGNNTTTVPPEELVVGDSEIAIRLSSISTPTTRSNYGGFTSLEHADGTFSTRRHIGVFCMASGRQPEYENFSYVTAPDWKKYGLYDGKNTTYSDVVLRNKHAKVSHGVVDFGSSTYYYPSTSWYRYDFYAHYVGDYATTSSGRTLNEVTFEQDDYGRQRYWVYKEIDGADDVIWGKTGYCTLTDTEKEAMTLTKSNGEVVNYSTAAYSAKFFRRQSDAGKGNQLPVLKFQHVLSRFKFVVVVGDKDAAGIKVSEVALLNMPYRLNMVVANNEAAETANGTLSSEAAKTALGEAYVDWEQTEGKCYPVLPAAGEEYTHEDYFSNFPLQKAVFTLNDDGTFTTSSKAVSFTIPTQDEFNQNSENEGREYVGSVHKFGEATDSVQIYALPGLDEYTLRVTLRTADGSKIISDQPLPFGNSQGWMGQDIVAEPGHSYTVKIVVYGPQKIEFKAELTDWEENDDPNTTDDDISIDLN